MTTSARRPLNVLFLGTENAARSIIAEAILNRGIYVRFQAFSAGLSPCGQVNPHAIRLLSRIGDPTGGLRSKSCDEFADLGAPALDFVFSVCGADDAARRYWPGQPRISSWDIPDPMAAKGSDAARALAFTEAYRVLNSRIRRFASLPLRGLHQLSLQKSLDDIGQTEEAAEAD
jgi:protein-tyrosine-phosphatase